MPCQDRDPFVNRLRKNDEVCLRSQVLEFGLEFDDDGYLDFDDFD